MSNTNKKPRKEGTKLAVRILSLFLAVLMVLGMAYIVIAFIADAVQAETTTTTEVLDTSSLNDSGDVLVSVGLMYGDDVTTGFEITTANSFTLGKQSLSGEKTFEEIWNLNTNAVSVTSDANLAKINYSYEITGDYMSTKIGAYHIQIDCDDLNKEEFELLTYTTDILIQGYGLYSIPAYIYTGYALRIGDFATWEDANVYYQTFVSLYPNKVVTVVEPSTTAVSVVNPYNDHILFEYDCGGASELGFRAAFPDANGNHYLKTPAGNVYDGVFAFKRFVDARNDGVELINILPLEAYISGVLPFEISNEWPIEVQKEFAIAARSFTLCHLNGKHSSYGFDLCNTDCCEVYKGAGRVNASVMEAVMGTKGTVICYDGNIVPSYYSSTVGGVTVSAADCWGGSEVPYLQAIETPWEDYRNHNNGFWSYEVTPYALCERLNKAGYNNLHDAIADVKITEFAKNSTYVKQLLVTDIYGNQETITYTDKVRTSLTPYVKSANFVVGRGSVEYTESAVSIPDPNGNFTQTIPVTPSVVTSVSTYSGQKDKSEGYADADELYVTTSESFDRIDYIGYVNVITSTCTEECTKKNIFVATRDTAEAYIGDEFNTIADQVGTESSYESAFDSEITKSEGNVTYKVAYAMDASNFIFVGKGWGHGVGLSQWGAYDLAVAGYTYDQIILAYFPTVSLVNYRLTKNFR